MCGKKIRASQSFDVISILTKDIIIICWWIMTIKEKLPKPYENIFYNIFSWYGTVSPIKDNFDILYANP